MPSADHRSAAAAREVAIRFASLVERDQLPEARSLWTEGGDFEAAEAQLRRFKQVKASIGEVGQMEGAAGSSYVEVPLQLTGQAESGEPLALMGAVTLRRVNDVPGSTEGQRRWHIYRIDLQPRP